MKLEQGMTAVVTGGASGLGEATVVQLMERGLNVVVVDLNADLGAAQERKFGQRFRFVKADVADEDGVQKAITAAEGFGKFRALVHCAGIGGAVRLIEKDGTPGSLEKFNNIIRVNLTGTYNVLRLAALGMAKNDPIEGERGACVLTASVAGYEGQIGQIPYAASKAGVIGMTIVAARDLASRLIRVCSIAPGLFDTPLLAKLPDKVRQSLAASVPNPARLGRPSEYAQMALNILENPMLNGETIRLDGAIRMSPR